MLNLRHLYVCTNLGVLFNENQLKPSIFDNNDKFQTTLTDDVSGDVSPIWKAEHISSYSDKSPQYFRWRLKIEIMSL